MKNLAIFCSVLLTTALPGVAQVSGSAGAYGGEDGLNPASIERAKRQADAAEREDRSGATYLDAAVLMNVRADEYVATFALFAQGQTPAAANAQMDQTLTELSASLDQLGIAPAERHLDFISQTRTYNFDITKETDDEGRISRLAVEKPSGFELRKNLTLRFRNIAQVEALVAAAARANVHDLVKVDYIVRDAAAIRERLQQQTLQLIRQKAARYNATLGTQLGDPVQIVTDSPGTYFPVEQYSNYVAAETQNLNSRYDRTGYTVVSARKSSTSFFAPLNGNGFDAVINPLIVEPVVQFTTYIKVKFAPPKKK